MKLTEKEVMEALNKSGVQGMFLGADTKREVLHRLQLHGLVEDKPKFAIAIPDEVDTDHYAVYDRTNGWLSGWDKEEIMNDKGFHFTMEEIEEHVVLSLLKTFVMEVK